MRDKWLVLFCFFCSFAIAQAPPSDTIAKPLTEKQKKKREQKLQRELATPYKSWFNEDVAYIISDEERQAFTNLSTDDERQSFVEQFWLRRDPTPDTEENEFKEEHYRRIAYANERFGSGIPGWKTDRGMIYIKFGPPDEIDSHPSGGTYQRAQQDGGGQSQAFPYETWRYRYIENIGTNVVIEFVDPTMSGEYRLTIDPTEKDALKHTPLAPQPQQITGAMSLRDEFDPIERMYELGKAPKTKFPDLRAIVSSEVRYNTLPLSAQISFIPVTPASIYANINLQIEASGNVNLYGQITTLSRRVAKTFEDVVSGNGPSLYQKTIPLPPGRYRLNIAAKDLNTGTSGTYETVLDVPQFDEQKLAASSLILADLMEPVPTRWVGSGQFVIGDTKVRPRINATFRSNEELGIYLQLYHLDSNSVVEYEIASNESGSVVLHDSEKPGSSSQFTVKKRIPLANLAAGSYTLRFRVANGDGTQTLAPTAAFTVTAR
ncbi:MAG TPA: GWxTD domain-containing protein [Bryobacteraceae bacterium]|nr:GWxTD domain-containing protein [Bryobacteraceae bacterium]